MKSFLYLITITALISACKSSSRQSFPATTPIDSSEYKIIIKKFKLRSVYPAQEYLGGLNPSYPIADAVGDITNGNIQSIDWYNGGMLPLYHKPVIKKGDDYVLINNKEDLKKIYAPLTSKEEALAYAILNTRYFAVLDKGFFKLKYRYNHGKPELSFVKQENGYYLVHLFKYQAFGCSHPYSSVLLKVMPNGDVSTIKIEEVFKDLGDDGMCVD